MSSRPAAERIRPRRTIETMGRLGGLVLVGMVLLCIATLPWTLATTTATEAGSEVGPRRFAASNPDRALLPPTWAPHAEDELAVRDTGPDRWHLFGTDRLGRDLFVRVLAGGGISLLIGLAAAATAVCIGTLVGTVAGWRGGATDAVLMRIVDILYGLPAILLVVLLAVAIDGWRSNWIELIPTRRCGSTGSRSARHRRHQLVDPGPRGAWSGAESQVASLHGGMSGHRCPVASAVHPSPASESHGADHRLRHIDRADGDAGGSISQLSRHRCPRAAAQLGQSCGGRLGEINLVRSRW